MGDYLIFHLCRVTVLPDMELVTPPLDEGIILPGVTRASLLELTRQWVS